jgi:hypothetical protein
MDQYIQTLTDERAEYNAGLEAKISASVEAKRSGYEARADSRLISAMDALDTLQGAKDESEQQERTTADAVQALASDAQALAGILEAAGTALDLRPWHSLERKMCKGEARILAAQVKLDAFRLGEPSAGPREGAG